MTHMYNFKGGYPMLTLVIYKDGKFNRCENGDK